MNLRLSIILPTFNEKNNVCLLIAGIKNVLSNFEYEVIMVDDNSPDGTYKKIAEEFEKDGYVRAILRKNERGLGTAILHGINNSRYPIIVGMDADFNHPPELIPQLLKEIENNDLIVASRFVKGGGMEEKRRYYPTLIFNNFLKHILGFPTMDNMSGFYAVKREKLLQLPLEKIYKGYGEYHLRLVYSAKKKGFRIKEVPVVYKKRKYGKSKSNLPKMFFLYLSEALKLKLFYAKFLQDSGFKA